MRNFINKNSRKIQNPWIFFLKPLFSLKAFLTESIDDFWEKNLERISEKKKLWYPSFLTFILGNLLRILQRKYKKSLEWKSWSELWKIFWKPLKILMECMERYRNQRRFHSSFIHSIKKLWILKESMYVFLKISQINLQGHSWRDFFKKSLEDFLK